jgi:murein DD-endopeptidase MepM/ murein hydrolase activator NlpD/uncharacterized protein YraI
MHSHAPGQQVDQSTFASTIMRFLRAVPSSLFTAGALVAALALGPAPVSAASAATTDPQPPAADPVVPEPTPTPTPTPTVPPATTFVLPVAAKTYTLSSRFGARCIPLPGASTYHLGIDLATKSGSPIAAVAAGVVTATVDGSSARAGLIAVKHTVGGTEYLTRYFHMWKSTTHVKVGQIVNPGTRISSVGSSGGSTGPHLHLEVLKRSGTGWAATDPAPFLAARGVDVSAAAAAVTARATPATCRYYSTTRLNMRSGPSTSKSVIRVLPRGTAMIHVPGRMTAGFIPVTVGTTTGWVSGAYVSPVKPVPPPTYVTTARLNLRATPSTSGTRILVIPKGATVGTIKATSGVWRKVTYAGKTGWVHSAYLKRK